MKKIKVLLVEDELIIGLDIKRALEGYGYSISNVVTTGEDAVREAFEQRPDLILMDIILSGEMNGIEAAKMIREKLDVPIIYLTANADAATVERARETIPSGYLNKPVSHRDLQSNIDTALYRYKMEARLRDSEHRFRELFENMKSGVAIYSAVDGGDDFVIAEINSATEKINKIFRKEATGQRVSKLFPAVKELGLLSFFRDVYLTGKPGMFPLTKYSDGRISIWVENYAYRLAGGELVVVHDDFTEKMRMIDEINEKNRIQVELNDKLIAVNIELESLNEKLQASLEELQAGNEELAVSNSMLMQSEENYRLLFNNAPVGLFHYNKSMIITETNEIFRAILSVTTEHLHGSKLQDDRLISSLNKPFNGEVGYYKGPCKMTADAIDKYISLKTVPVFNFGRDIIGGFGFVLEIPKDG